ncbi:MAG: ribosome biogenesis GTPase YlqF [Bacillales bacterium]|nr:ribosome biogenesis GTPase YlqF [Bacillales bacterium]
MQQKSVHWFPGHMQKAMREIEEKLKLIDIVIEIVDARAPKSSKNKFLERLTKSKKRIIVMSKKDLADPNLLRLWEEKYKNDGYYPVACDLNNNQDIKNILNAIQFIGKDKMDRDIRRGLKPQPIRIMIIGIPNVGKSTLINRLSKRGAASIANTPGHTRSQQWIRVNKTLELLDTPGILPPHYDDKMEAIHLALIGSMKIENISETELLEELLKILINKHADKLMERYDLSKEDLSSNNNIFLGIAKRRGLLLSQGQYDLEKAELLLLKEFKEGLIVKTIIDELC